MCLFSKGHRWNEREGEGGSDQHQPAYNYDGYRVKLSMLFCLTPPCLGDTPIKGRNESSYDMNNTGTGVDTQRAILWHLQR